METQQKRKRSFYGLVTRIVLWVILIGIIMFLSVVFLTSVMGGKGEAQRAGIEHIFSSISGHPAKIQMLNDYQLLPDLKMDFENMAVLSDTGDMPLLIVQKVVYVQDALQHFMGGDMPIVEINLVNLLTAPGYLGPYTLHLENVRVIPLPEGEEKGDTVLKADGNYGGYPLVAEVPLKAALRNGRMQYGIDPGRFVTLSLGDLSARAYLRIEKEAVLFKEVQIVKEKETLTGTIAIPRRKELKEGEAPVAVPAALITLQAQNDAFSFDGSLRTFSTAVEITGTAKGTPPAGIIKDLKKMMTVVKQEGLGGAALPPPDLKIEIEQK